MIQLPPGASLQRTDALVRKATKIILETDGVVHAVPFAGFDGATFTTAPNAGAIFAALAPFPDRVAKGLSADHILADLRKRLGAIEEAFIIVIPPPPVRGIGNAGGFKMMVQDKRGRGLRALEAATQELVGGRQSDARPGRRVLAVQYAHTQALRRYRPREGRDAGRARRRRVRRRSRSISARST